MTTLHLTPIATIKALVDHLADLGITPLHLHIDGRADLDQRPDVRLWTRTRTDLFALCDSLGVKPREDRYNPEGQRHWHAEHDTEQRRLLIQCCSLQHHDDWEAKA